jgi:N-acetylglucosaminyldiphosphoundecaprenol N-acetyl-beta-D-mannosaminyltransferase
MNINRNRKNTNVLGVPIAAADPALALSWIEADLREHRKGYVCFVSVHGLMESLRDPQIAKSYKDASLRLPDGAPVAWVGWLQGERNMRRVAGPEMMLDVFADPRLKEATHYLYGGEPGVADLLRTRLLERFPEARIVGIWEPPFRDLNASEEERFLREVHEVKPDIMWVGLGCPKQEIFMRRYIGKLDTTLMFGVGAAFDFHTGRLQDSPVWVKRAGMQWFHRLLQDPRRLWKRYLVSNSAFLWRLALQLIGITRVPVASKAPQEIGEPHPRASR